MSRKSFAPISTPSPSSSSVAFAPRRFPGHSNRLTARLGFSGLFAMVASASRAANHEIDHQPALRVAPRPQARHPSPIPVCVSVAMPKRLDCPSSAVPTQVRLNGHNGGFDAPHSITTAMRQPKQYGKASCCMVQCTSENMPRGGHLCCVERPGWCQTRRFFVNTPPFFRGALRAPNLCIPTCISIQIPYFCPARFARRISASEVHTLVAITLCVV